MRAPANAASHGAATGWVDINDDGWPELVIGDPAGPTRVFVNEGGQRFSETYLPGLSSLQGLLAIDHIVLGPDQMQDGGGFARGLILVLRSRGHDPNLVIGRFLPSGEFEAIPVGSPATLLHLSSHGDVDGDSEHEVVVGQFGCTSGRADTPTVYLLSRYASGYRRDDSLGLPRPGCWPMPFVTDYDDSGTPRIFLATDFGPLDVTTTVLFDGVPSLVAPTYSMGIAVGDHEGDGDLDYVVTSVGRDLLWRDDGASWSPDILGPDTEWGADGLRFKWGATYLDADNDSREELWITAGGSQISAFDAEPNARNILLVDGVDRAYEAGVDSETSDRTISVADYDRDGRMDAVVAGEDALTLYRNVTEDSGHWLRLRIQDEPGTRATVTACGRSWQKEWSGGVTGAAHDTVLHFGLGDCAEPATVAFRDPWRTTRTLGPLAVDQEHRVDPPLRIAVWPRVASPGSKVQVRANRDSGVSVNGVPIVGGRATLPTPTAPGTYRLTVVEGTETLRLTPKLVVGSLFDDVTLGVWPPLRGVPTQLFLPPGISLPENVRGAQLKGDTITPFASEVTLEWSDGQTVFPTFARFADPNACDRDTPQGFGCGLPVGLSQHENGRLVQWLQLDGRGVIAGTDAEELKAHAVLASGITIPMTLDARPLPWRAGVVQNEATAVRVFLPKSDSSGLGDDNDDDGNGWWDAASHFDIPLAPSTGEISWERSRLWALHMFVRTPPSPEAGVGSHDVLELAVVLVSPEGEQVVPGPEHMPDLGPGFVPLSDTFERVGHDLANVMYAVRYRVDAAPGHYVARLKDLTTDIYVVGAAHMPPEATSGLTLEGDTWHLVPRDRFGQRVGPGVVTDPEFEYVRDGVYARPAGGANEIIVRLDDRVVVAYRNGASAAIVLTPAEEPAVAEEAEAGGCQERARGAVPWSALALAALALLGARRRV